MSKRTVEYLKYNVKKKDKKKIICKNGDRETQVDYILVRVNENVKFKDCKVFSEVKKTIKVWKLKHELVRAEF